MTARNIISPRLTKDTADFNLKNLPKESPTSQRNYVDAGMPLLDVFRKFMDSSQGVLAVMEDEKVLGYIDRQSMLEALGKVLIPRDDCSIIEIECMPEDFSASRIAHAVEDADANLFDMFSRPTDDGHVCVMLRVGHLDPSSVIRSLERYDFTVTAAYGSLFNAVELSCERLAELALYLNI